MSDKVQVNVTSAITGISMWLFTIGMTHPSFGGAVLDILLWPYRLGAAVAQIAGLQ